MIVACWRSEYFYDLCKIGSVSDDIAEGITIRPEAVCADLKVSFGCIIKLFSKSDCVLNCATAKVERQNKLCILFDCHECIGITDLFVIVIPLTMLCLFLHFNE